MGIGSQVLLHEATGFFCVLRTIPLNVFMWYYALANEICIGKSVTFVLEVLLNYVPYTINYRKHVSELFPFLLVAFKWKMKSFS